MIVRWIDGREENCWPQSIELIPDGAEYTYSIEEDDDGTAQVSWETETVESVAGDITDEATLQNMAARLDFVRSRIVYLKKVFKDYSTSDNFSVSILHSAPHERAAFVAQLLINSSV